MNISEAFIRRPIGTSLLAMALFLLGLAVFPLLPVAPLPQVDFPTIQVTAKLPGGNPETMATSVAQPLEREFSTIPGLVQMSSENALGASRITLQFALDRDIDGAALDVQSAINAASRQLPSNLSSPPTFRKVNPADFSILILSVQSDVLPVTEVNDYADNILAQQLSRVEGVGQVNIFGQQKPAIRIQVDPQKIAALGLDLESIRGVIATTTVNQPKGTIDGSSQSYTIYTNDQVLDAAPWNDVIVAWRNGAPVRVRDIGIAVPGPEDTKQAAWAFAGKGAGPGDVASDGRSLVMGITKQPGANVIDTVERVRAELPRLMASMPASIQVSTLIDRTQNIRASVHEVEFTLLLSIALVVMVIFMFLRNVAGTLIASATVPLALMGTFALMYVAGYSLDNLSLMALTISVGFVIDDAVVMLENIWRHVEEGMRPMEAALKGAREIGFTIVSISVSLAAVFIPLLLMGGMVGRLFREFAVTVVMTVLISVLVTLSLTPMLCSRYLRNPQQASHGRIYQAFERGFDRMLAVYRRGLDHALDHQFATLCVFLATVAASAALFIVIPKGFFPQQDTGAIFGLAESSQDSSFEAMNQRMMALAEVLRQDPDIAAFGMSSNAPTFNTGRFFISLKPREAGRRASADDVIRRLRPQLEHVPGVRLFMQAGQDINVGGRLSRTQYQYTLTSASLDELNAWAPRLLDRLRGLPQLADLATDQQNGANTAMVTIDRARAAMFGITPAMIDSTIYNALGQRQVAQYSTQINSYQVVLEITPELQSDPDVFSRLYVKSPLTGEQVPLSSLTRLDTSKPGFLSINHQGQFPAVTISFNLAAGHSLGQAVDAIHAAQASMNMPLSIQGAFQGTAQVFQESLASQPYLIAAALVAVYIVLGLLYESYIHPLTILSTLPSAGVGALLILMGSGFDLSVIAIIGILLLIGIVKKNGIMLIDFALVAERQQGLSPREAIYQACLLRFRPIMMTTMCALLAGLPLMLGTGAGSELRQPLGYTMVGGLILSQALTLFTTPVVYLYLDRLHHRYVRGRALKQAQRLRPARVRGRAA
ncbi:Cobalt-zinc-cadmium resistance protein CzcA; Cation efflux system protein CusA [Castellaniella defragrans 65Phen]|uniref:Cobalt-zinc-cadmium resistance protein CzcA Cation efflux system protein CusA n=1 Tax=Castellaniella defragrans (strain DSM 12143 / CCUG 39792 / 65Phen) TaxID=1437824 RepID=W8WZW3_CASD6|nr:efflux RND transporter permease subunit [Castellaniella defragrans]CDM25333.1 Cobalt-zinc-cadmium resistance protein CzcA; Cation efflux system protein CusA [Castellaniella defragrans 65Phen]